MIAAFRGDGRALAYGDSRRMPFTAEVWDLDSARVSATSPPVPAAAGLAFTDPLLMSGQLVDGSDPSHRTWLSRWDLRTGAATTNTPGIHGYVIAVDPAGRLVVTSEGDVADLSPGRVARRSDGPGPAGALAFSPDGRFLAVGNGAGQTTLWDGSARHQLGTLIPASASNLVTALAFSSDGGTLAVGMPGGSIQLWDTAARQPIGAPISTPVGNVSALSLNGDALYVAGEHIPLRRYDLSSVAAEATICRRVTRGLSPEEWTEYLPGYSYQPACG